MYVLFDFSNFCYLAFHASLRMTGFKPEEVDKDYNFHVDVLGSKLSKMRDFLASAYPNKPYRIVFATDRKAKMKFELYPEYKAKRKKMEFNPLKGGEELVRMHGYDIIYAEESEADDVIFSFVHQNPQYKHVVVSTDKDLWLLKDLNNVDIINPLDHTFVGKQHLKKSFDLDEYKYVTLYKALWGDSSDNIPNAVPRMKKQLLPVIAACDGTLDDFYSKLGEFDLSKRCLDLIEEGKPQVAINYQIVHPINDCVIRQG